MIHALRRTPVGMVVVQGDTSSALGGALGAAHLGIAVAHVEAGLRTGDLSIPWPEEGYRIEIDRIAGLLFAPTELAASNLRREDVTGEICVTGNTSIDALLEVLRQFPAPCRSGNKPRVLVTCHRRENWGSAFRSIASAIRQLAGRDCAEFDVLLHPNPHHSTTIEAELKNHAGIRLVEPCSHCDLIRRMSSSNLVLSDSGGMQEEAPALGVPILVLRSKTERPEGILAGNALLVGTDTTAIIKTVEHLLSDPAALAAMSHRAFPFGDGKAAPRIAAVIDQWLKSHTRTNRQANPYKGSSASQDQPSEGVEKPGGGS